MIFSNKKSQPFTIREVAKDDQNWLFERISFQPFLHWISISVVIAFELTQVMRIENIYSHDFYLSQLSEN